MARLLVASCRRTRLVVLLPIAWTLFLFLLLLLSSKDPIKDTFLRFANADIDDGDHNNDDAKVTEELQISPKLLKQFPSLARDPVVNVFDFDYLINVPDACSKRSVELVVAVHSAVTNFRRRKVARSTKQAKYVRDHGNTAVMVFFVGIPSGKLKYNTGFQMQVEKESQLYNDIVQINMTETYHHLSYKSMAVLNWVSNYCSNSQVVIKMDDDVNINIAVHLAAVQELRLEYPHFIVGELRENRQPGRDKKLKWYMSEEEYPNTTYPPFVPGPVIGYPAATAPILFQQAKRTKMIWLDDIFITGLCREALGIPIFGNTNFKVGFVLKRMNAPNFVVN